MKRIGIAHIALSMSLVAVGLSTTAVHGQAVQKPMGEVTGVSGWIEDGIAHNPGNSSDAVKKSVANGAPLVFVDDKSKMVYKIDDPEKVKGHEGHHVSFSGSIDSVGKTVHINTLSMMKSQTPGAAPEAVGH